MSRVTKAISDELLELCKIELKQQGVRGENGRRLQAIISAKEHGISQVAKVYGISRETLMRWISKFKSSGSKYFAIGSGRGRRAKLSYEQKLEIQDYIEKEGATLASKRLQLVTKERFGIEVSKSTAHRLCKSLGFSYITPRPRHYKKDQARQEELKKKS